MADVWENTGDMSEYVGSDSSEDSDDSSEHTSTSTERAPANAIGGALFAAEKGNDNKAPESFWNRGAAEAEATKQSFLAELVGERPDVGDVESDDDDDEAEADEKAAPLESLSQAEQQVVIRDYLEQREAELKIDHGETAADEIAATAANQLMVEHTVEQLDQDPGATPDAVVDAAGEATKEDIDDVIDAVTAEATSAETDVEAADDEEDDGTTTVASSSHTPPPPLPTPVAPPTGPPSPPTPPITPTFPPPPPPGPPGGPVLPPSPFGLPPSPGSGPGSSFNSYRGPSAALTEADIEAARRHGETSGLVIGGILGYLIGRRRGRIKTERKLLPIQKNLESQVKGLHETVDNKEREVRGLTADKINLLDESQRGRAAGQLQAQAAKRSVETQPVASKFSQELQRLIPEDRPGTGPVAERFQARPELVAPMFINNEAAPPREHIENVERLSQREILEMSEKVVIAGARLRDIYETKLITESGLRHILTEFLSGGDIKKALDQELAVKQLTYERDPKLRDQLSAGYGTNGGASAGAAATPMGTAQSPASVQQGGNSTAHQSSDRSNAESKDGKSDAAVRREQMMVGGWMAGIAVLLIIVFILISQRS